MSSSDSPIPAPAVPPAPGGGGAEGGSTSDGEERASSIAEDRQQVLDLMSGYYREEMRRALTWRGRLDRTTNWSVVLTAALLTWSFSSREHPHYVILIAMLAVLLFLLIETRRYRYFDVYRARLRLLEEDVFACTLDPQAGWVHEGWRAALARDLRQPAFKVGWLEACQRRLRRVYLYLLTVLAVAWLFRVWARPQDRLTLVEAASIEGVAGELVLSGVGVFLAALMVLAFWPVDRKAKGGVRGEVGDREEWRDGEPD